MRNLFLSVIGIAAVAVFASAIVGVAAAQESEDASLMEGVVFTVIDEVPAPLRVRGVIRAGTVRLPSDTFGEEPPDDPPEPVTIPIGVGRSVNLIEQRRQPASNGKTMVIGIEDGVPHSRFIMFVKDGVLLHGEIRLQDVIVNLTAPEPDNGFTIFQLLAVDPRGFPDERRPVRHSGGGGEGDPAVRDESATADQIAPEDALGLTGESNAEGPAVVEVKVLVAYTPMAKEMTEASWPNQSIEEKIIEAIDGANAALVPQAGIRLVHAGTVPLPYLEDLDIEVDLRRLACPCDHRMSGVGNNHLNGIFQAWKDSGADLVSLWIHSPVGDAGISYDPAYFANDVARRSVSVVDWYYATWALSFDHEIGHNFYAVHDRAQEPDEALPWNYNYGFVNADYNVVTMMAYTSTCASFGAACTRIGNWSDPTLSPPNVWGLASGPLAAHNARTLNETRTTIANLSDNQDEVGCCIKYGNWLISKYRPGPCP